MRNPSAQRILWSLVLVLLGLLPLVFLPWTVEVYVVPKAVLLWIVAFGALAAFLAIGLIDGELAIDDSLATRALVAFCIAAAAATALSVTPAVSLFGAFIRREGLLSLLSYALVFFLVLRLTQGRHETPGTRETGKSDRLRRIEQAAVALVIPVIPISVYAVAQGFGFEFAQGLNSGGAGVRAYGTFGNADLLAVYAALTLPILAALALKSKGVKRAVLAAGLLLDIIALLLSYTRSGWLGSILGALLLALLTASSERGKRRLRPALALLIVAGLAVLLALGLRSLQPAPAETSFTARAATMVDAESGGVATRLEVWRRSASLIMRRPVLGHGPEAFRGQFMPVRGERVVRLEGLSRWDRPHNSMLYLASAIGLLGLACYLIFLGAVLVPVCLRLKSAEDDVLTAGLVAGALGACVSEFFIFWSPGTTPLVFAVLSLAYASVRPSVRERRLRVPPVIRPILLLPVLLLAAGVFWAAIISLRADYYADLARLAGQRKDAVGSAYYFERASATAWWINDYRWRAARRLEEAGFLRRDAEQLRRAEAILIGGLRVDPYDEKSYAQLGDVYRNLWTIGAADALNESEESYRRALELDPFLPSARKGLARVLYRREDYGGALSEALAGLRFAEDDEELLYLAGVACGRLGEKTRAVTYLKEALRLAPADPLARAALRDIESGQGGSPRKSSSP